MKTKVLLVDDDVSVLAALSDLLRAEDYDVIDAFNGLNAHQAIKKIQADAGLECDVTHTDIPGLGVLVSKQPRSLSFESMEQGQFYEFTRAACRHIASTYWPHLTAEQVQEMADTFPDDHA